MEEWKNIKACDYCYNVTDGTHDSPKQKESGKYLITSRHIKNNRIDFESAYKISEDDYNKIISRSKVNQWDIIISMIGAYCGYCCIESSKQTDYAIKNVGLLKVGNELRCKWLYYYLTSPYGKQQLSMLRSGSSQPYISLGALRNLEIPIPNREVMSSIVSILSALDAKIELNRRINDNLEQQAQALFKSWFVDFEPFKGEKFMESQLGMIPKGWKVGTLSDLLDIRYGKDHKKLNDGNVPVYGSGGIMRLADGILYNGESVLIPRKGTLNNVLYVNWPFWAVDTMFYSIEKVPNVAKYCHLLLSKLDLASMNSGSAVPSMTTDILNKIQVIVAKQDVFSSFNKCISSLYLKAKINLDENKRLSETRDLLLPKLMSGRLIINDLHS